MNISDDTELYSDRDVRVTGSALVAGEKRFAIRDITAITVEHPNEKKLGISIIVLYLSLFLLALFGGMPSWMLRVIIVAHIVLALSWMVALLLGWSYVIPMLQRWDEDRRSMRVVMITVGRRRVPVLTSNDEQHVDSVARALRNALRRFEDGRQLS